MFYVKRGLHSKLISTFVVILKNIRTLFLLDFFNNSVAASILHLTFYSLSLERVGHVITQY